jgi:hypothetical protein
MIVVTAPAGPRRITEASSIPESMLASYVSGLSFDQCLVIGELVETELYRRGFRRVKYGGRVYQFIESKVVADLVRSEVDLSDIVASMEEARWMAEMDGEPGEKTLLHFY